MQPAPNILRPCVGQKALPALGAGMSRNPIALKTRSSVVLRCRKCKVTTSLAADTVMQSAHTALSTWFWGAYLVTTQTPGQSALQFQRQLGLSRYETVFQILHKLRAGMVRPECGGIGGAHPVEVDECLVGGNGRGAKGAGCITWLPWSGRWKLAPGKTPNSAPRNTGRRMRAECRSRNSFRPAGYA